MLNQYLGYGFIAVAFVVLLYKDNLLKLLVKQPAQPKVEESGGVEITVDVQESKSARSKLFESLDFIRVEFRSQGNDEGFKAINEAGKALFQDDLNETK